MYACGIDKRHLTHADDAHLGTVAKCCHDLLKLVACTKEVRAVYLIHLHAFRDEKMLVVLKLEVCLIVGVNLIEDGFHVCGLCHSFHEQQTSNDQSHLNGYGEVEDDGEKERYEQHRNIALGVLCQHEEGAPTAHAIAHNHKNSCKTCHGDVLC